MTDPRIAVTWQEGTPQVALTSTRSTGSSPSRVWLAAAHRPAGPGLKWFTESDISIGRDQALFRAMKESGCAQILVGLESPQAGLEGQGRILHPGVWELDEDPPGRPARACAVGDVWIQTRERRTQIRKHHDVALCGPAQRASMPEDFRVVGVGAIAAEPLLQMVGKGPLDQPVLGLDVGDHGVRETAAATAESVANDRSRSKPAKSAGRSTGLRAVST